MVSGLKVALVVPSLERSGPTIGVHELARGIQAQGTELCVIALSEPRAGGEGIDFSATGVRVIELKGGRRQPVKTFRKFRRALCEFKPAIIHSTGFRADAFTVAACVHLPGVQLVTTIRQRFQEELGFALSGARLKLMVRAWLWALRRFDVVAAHCEAIKENLEALGLRGDIRVVPNGVDTMRFRPPSNSETIAAKVALGISPEKFVAGYIGRLNRLKRIEKFIEGLAKCPEVTGLIVGNGPEESFLKQFAAHMEVQDRIVWRSQTDDVRPYYWALDGFVILSATEGLPRAFLEAGSCGLPVVASAIPTFQEILGDGLRHWIVDDARPETVAERLGELAADRSASRSIGRELSELVHERYSSERMIEGYRNLYSQLLTRSAGA